ncbi:hypothetical protein M5K25_011977 [Dendrobium thyrsiflorum]|uniref:Uncharacterized protein n=1 Tax=Dendrobium thyrsiflorum TaxID=117978 RepID=A0ABD0V5H5_DENTH
MYFDPARSSSLSASLYQLTLAVEEHIHPERWEIISRHPPPPTPATFPSTGILRAFLLVVSVLFVWSFAFH